MFRRNGKRVIKKVKRLAPNAIIVVERTKKRILRYVPEKHIPQDSFMKLYNKKWYHLLGLDLSGALWPITAPKAEDAKSPIDLFTAVHCATEVNEVYGQGVPTIEKVKLGIFIGIVAICGVLIFFKIVGGM